MLEVTFKVFDITTLPVKVPATLRDGSTIEATIEATRVQLVPDDAEAHSTIALILTGGDAENAIASFKAGDRITAIFTKE